MNVKRSKVFQSSRDRDRWHVVITVGSVARDFRLPHNPPTRRHAEQQARKLFKVNQEAAK
jgi:hypothetical protein